jgi:peptidoglycan L-alanyl-D-glutamate endopeptidase CwlK
LLFFSVCQCDDICFYTPIQPTHIEAEYLKEVDPQIYTLLNGEILTPPPEVDESLVEAAIVEANQLEQQYQLKIISRFRHHNSNLYIIMVH